MTKDQEKKTTLFRFNGIEFLHSNLPFICFSAVLVLFYIGIAHSAEKKKRKMQALKIELKQARWQYEMTKNKVIYNSTQSQLAKNLEENDEEVRATTPIKIKDTRK